MPTAPRTYLQRLRDAKPQPVRRDEAPRVSPSKLGYGRAWRRLRIMVLRDQPMCAGAGCNQPATEVDHRVAKAKGGDDSRGNLVGLCCSCHSRKSVREDGALRPKSHDRKGT